MIELENWGYIDLSKIAFVEINHDNVLDLYSVKITFSGGAAIESPKMEMKEVEGIMKSIRIRKSLGGC